MAANDILPFVSPMGGHHQIFHFRLNAGESFREGEPVSLNADGELTESGDDPVDADLLGIAAGPGDTTDTGLINPRTGVAYATGDLVPVYLPSPQNLFRTANFSSAGSAFDDVAPTVSELGDEAGLSLIGGSWGIDISATNNTCRIMDILDSRKQSIQRTGGTLSVGDAYWVIFTIVAHQNASLGTADAPVA